MAATLRKPFSPSLALYLAAGQVALAVIIAAVTSTELDMDNGDCLLNIIPGRVCDFVYCTVGFSLLFTLMLAVPTIIWQSNVSRKNSVPLIAEAGHLALFAAFWWMVMAITITIRGGQAADKGYGAGSARGATIGLSWIQAVLFLAAAAIVGVDRFKHHQAAKQSKEDDTSSEGSGKNYAYTQALAHLPVS